MAFKHLLAGGAAALALTAGQAQAATINLVDLGGVAGSPSERGFKIAAAYWGGILTNNVTINLGVGFDALDPGVIGSTGSTQQDYTVANWKKMVNTSKSGSTLDQSIVLPGLNSSGGASLITNGVAADGNNDTGVQAFVDGTSVSSQKLYMNTSLIKAIGGTVNNPNALDGEVTFSSNFAFDFNPTDGITANTFDFIGVAIHEIGHALGFVSGVDFLDAYGYPDGPGAGQLGYDLNDTSIFSALDMFRYSNDPNGLAPGGGPVLDLTVGTKSYFSIDGGKTALFGNEFSTGRFNGDGNQASHWLDAEGANACGPQLGIMDPTFCFGQMGEITALDLAAFDAMGWNTSVDALGNPNYLMTSSAIYDKYAASVPEPSTWLMLIGGFGLMGAALRRRRFTTFAAATA